MSTQGSALANVLKKSLTVTPTLGEKVSWWGQAAADLHKEYEALVKLHDSIEPKLKTEWADLKDKFDELQKKMLALEATTVGSGEDDRKKYTGQVTQLILQAKNLEKGVKEKQDIAAEAQRTEAIKQKKALEEQQKRSQILPDYKNAVAMLDTILKYTEANDVKGNKEYGQIKEWIKWDQAGASLPQMSAIVSGVEKIKQTVSVWDKQAKSNQAAENTRQEEETARLKLQTQKLQEKQKKESDIEAERKEKIVPVRTLLQEVLREAKEEQADFVKLDKQLADYLKAYDADKKFAESSKRVTDLRKQIILDGRNTLTAQTASLPDVVKYLEGEAADLEKLTPSGLDALGHELVKVRGRIDAFEDKRTADNGYGDRAIALDPAIAARPAHDTKSTGYVFTDELGTAEAYKKDMIGILAGARAGRTSPNGKANHIHVGGDATNNVIFDRNGPGSAVRVLGFVNGHMEKRMAPPVRAEASIVEGRASSGLGSFTAIEVDLKDKSWKQV